MRLRRLAGIGAMALVLGCPDEPGLSGSGVDSVGSTHGTDPSDGTTTPGSTGTSSDSSGGAVDTTEGQVGGTSGGPEPLPRYLQYIRSDPYPRLVLEVDYVEGMEPYLASMDGIESVFGQVLDKPGGVEVVLDESLPTRGGDPAWTHAERDALAAETFDLPVPDDTVKMHVLMLDGHAAEDDAEGGVVLGFAWGHLNIVLFREQIVSTCEDALIGPLTQTLCEQAEFLVWQHEVGHVIGLVDAGLPMQTDHRDERNGPHDVDPQCVMFWGYDRSDAVVALVEQLTTGAPAIEFDPLCLDDIDAAK